MIRDIYAAAVQAAKEKKKPARGFDIMQDLVKNPVPIKKKSSEKPVVEVFISHDNLSHSNILWKDKKLVPSKDSVEAFKKRGYYYSSFPEGDGAAFNSASHKSDDKIRQDIRECFNFEVKEAKKAAFSIKGNKLNPVIKYQTKSHYGGPELVYVLSEHKESLHTLTNSKTLTPRHVKALEELGFVFEK